MFKVTWVTGAVVLACTGALIACGDGKAPSAAGTAPAMPAEPTRASSTPAGSTNPVLFGNHPANDEPTCGEAYNPGSAKSLTVQGAVCDPKKTAQQLLRSTFRFVDNGPARRPACG
ncbi:hypothetical protein [Micromonospora vulcania]|uniref:Uncharacterized protein n=1 Tax=Micromonospora vulcania TaxID=1441873 RepID=A0ABW1H1X3_9ACTN